MNMKRFLAASLALSLLVAAGATAVNAQVEPTASASVAQEEEPSIKSVSLGIGSNEQQRTITWLSDVYKRQPLYSGYCSSPYI